ncbi:MAG: hypothetical protein WCD79_08640 [Chthoniobacteraceae bacterium]
MKLLKINMAALLVLMLGISASQASTTVIRLIGSTAYRGAVENAITHTLQSGFTFAWYTDPNTGFSSIDKAQAVIYSGTTSANGSGNNVAGVIFPANTAVIIKAYWGGSVGGAKALVKLETPTSDSSNWWLSETGNTLSTTGTRLTSPVWNDATVSPDAAFSDAAPSTIQAYLANQSVPWSITGYSEAQVGVNTFVFVKSLLSTGSTMSGTFNNITALQFRAAAQTMPLSVITGSAADSGITVAPMGRDEDSGTRITALAESGLGTTTLLQQIQPVGFDNSSSHITGISIQNAGTGYTSVPTVTITNAPADSTGSGATATAVLSGSTTVASITITGSGTGYSLPPTVAISGGGGSGATANASIGGSTMTVTGIWPAATVAQVSYPAGDSGFTNGPDLAYAMNQVPAATDSGLGIFPAIFVGYLSVGDAAGVASGNNALLYNGAACTAANIENGQYSFWSYEHMYWKTTNANAAYMKGIAQQLYIKESAGSGANVNGTSVAKTLRLIDMQVSRGTEGTLITSGNTATGTVTIANH